MTSANSKNTPPPRACVIVPAARVARHHPERMSRSLITGVHAAQAKCHQLVLAGFGPPPDRPHGPPQSGCAPEPVSGRVSELVGCAVDYTEDAARQDAGFHRRPARPATNGATEN